MQQYAGQLGNIQRRGLDGLAMHGLNPGYDVTVFLS